MKILRYEDLTEAQREWHRNLWDNDGNIEDYWKLVQAIRPKMTWRQYDHAWQFMLLNHPSWDQAKVEFMMLINLTY